MATISFLKNNIYKKKTASFRGYFTNFVNETERNFSILSNSPKTIRLCLTGAVYKKKRIFLSIQQKSYKSYKETHYNLALDQVDQVVGRSTR